MGGVATSDSEPGKFDPPKFDTRPPNLIPIWPQTCRNQE